MSLDKIRIVLVRTTHPGNIGAAARAMANMGLEHLYLVQPRTFPSAEATARAAGAEGLLCTAKVCETLDEAVAECGLVVGSTARERRVRWPALDPDLAMAMAFTQGQAGNVALVFGQEASGLTNDELDRCQVHVRIPVDPVFPSVNLAAAVMVLSYELKKAHIRAEEEGLGQDGPRSLESTEGPLATAEKVQGFFVHLETVLREIGFLNSPSEKLLRKVKRIFSRTPLLDDDINILRGVLSAIQGRKARDSGATRIR
jgi:tRNA (cytidine32/uridine32-2'-O)-methyltransferase|tara:strand:+ start:3643 stop:4413 length:771 start_codon:yes stop_codon:yes gene_type:complete